MRKRLNSRNTICILCLLASCLFIGCKKKDQTSAATQKAPSVSVKVPPKAANKLNTNVQSQVSSSRKTQAETTYSFKNKKDPFKPLITPPEAPSVKVPSKTKVSLADALPIQSHETNQFTVTGIITGFKENKALLVDPTGKGYVVKKGMLVGDNGGHISKITTSSVEVAEQYHDDKKRVKTRIIVLPLAKKSKENLR